MITCFSLLILGSAPAGLSDPDRPLTVELERLTPGPYVVGQSIEVRLRVVAEAEAPAIQTPESPAVSVVPLDRHPAVQPISATAIGRTVHEVNVYRYRYVLIPRQTGALTLPPFRAKAGPRAGTSAALRLTVNRPPRGAPSWFLGGVGPIEVELAVQPEAIRLGETATVEVRQRGPGARGANRPPRLSLDGPEAAVEPLGPERLDPPPSRLDRFRLRPTQAGAITIGPVRVATLDPSTNRYMTSLSKSVTLRVEDPPPFDPAAIEVGPDPGAASATGGSTRLWIGAGLAVAAGAAGALGWAARRLGSRSASARRRAARTARALNASLNPPQAARIAMDGLTAYLRRAVDRPEGALTPIETRRHIETITGDPGLAEEAERLVRWCDAARFGGASEAPGDSPAAAPAFFRRLARAGRRINDQKSSKITK